MPIRVNTLIQGDKKGYRFSKGDREFLPNVQILHQLLDYLLSSTTIIYSHYQEYQRDTRLVLFTDLDKDRIFTITHPKNNYSFHCKYGKVEILDANEYLCIILSADDGEETTDSSEYHFSILNRKTGIQFNLSYLKKESDQFKEIHDKVHLLLDQAKEKSK